MEIIENNSNQIIYRENGTVNLISYKSHVAQFDGTTLTLGRDFDYSRTTARHLTQFLSKYCYFISHNLLTYFSKINSATIRKAMQDPNFNIVYNPAL